MQRNYQNPVDVLGVEKAFIWRLYADWAAIDRERYLILAGRVDRKLRRFLR